MPNSTLGHGFSWLAAGNEFTQPRAHLIVQPLFDSDLRRTPVGRRLERDDVEECEERAGRNAPRTAMALYRVCFDHVRSERGGDCQNHSVLHVFL